MEEKKNAQKFTPEQLGELLNQATQQNMQLRQSLEEAQRMLFYKRLDYLFEMTKMFDVLAVDVQEKVVNEIVSSMFPQEKEEE